MRYDTKLDLKLKQTIGISPQMLLEAELLQLPILELSQRIQKEIEENPCLEEVPRPEEPREEKKSETELKGLEDLRGESPHPYITKDSEDDDKDLEPEAPQIGFWDRIEAQIAVNYEEGTEEGEIARTIIDHLDGKGFLSTPVSEIARILKKDEEKIEKIRQEIMRNLDPVGVASLDRRELFLVQLESMDLCDSFIYNFIRDHWLDCQSMGTEEVLTQLGVTEEERREIQKIFQSLYSAPIERYSEERSEYVYPEVIIKLVEGKLVVEIAEWGLPKVNINPYYFEILNRDESPGEVKKFLKERMKRALDFLKALENRRENIIKVAEFIVTYQEDFLMGKTKYLNPITQTEAAQRLNIPISTFNRVVKGRYADTPVGIFELKFFFAKGVQMGGIQVSQEILKEKIRELIRNESPDNPLSDKEISLYLRREGFDIARRTVAEYRKEMGIPSSKKRHKK
jgi:RNA polymerase sigma-54 factor